MSKTLNVAIIGLDTSHAVHFPERMQSPDIPQEQRVNGMFAKTCMKFLTPFTDDGVLAERTAKLESWGVKVTEKFDEAVADCDAILLEINDPAIHLEYFTRCAEIGVPIFLDKPMADTYAGAKAIANVAERNGVRFFTASSLRFVAELESASASIGKPEMMSAYGALGVAAAGSSIVWYGVHAFEMLERGMGIGATKLTTVADAKGAVVVVEYSDGRRGIVELTRGSHQYGGCLRNDTSVEAYAVNMDNAYSSLLRRVVDFLTKGAMPVDVEDSLEITKLLDAAERSSQTGKPIDL